MLFLWQRNILPRMLKTLEYSLKVFEIILAGKLSQFFKN